MMTQTQMILADLLAGKRITALDALRDYGCFRLGARIWDIKELGYDVKTEMIETPMHKKRIARYYIDVKAAPLMAPGEQARLFT